MNARDFNYNHAVENGKNPNVFWGMQDYFLFAKEGEYITSFTTGELPTVEEEILHKGRSYESWLVENKGEITFYKVENNKVKKIKTIKGKIEEDCVVESGAFGAVGGGTVSKFINYRIVEQ